MQTGPFARAPEPQVGDPPGRRAPAHAARWLSGLASWRATRWVLAGWTVTVGLWILAEILPFEQCPYGQRCVRAPALTNRTAIAGWVLLWLAGIATLLLAVWRDRQQPRTTTAISPRRSRWLLIVSCSFAGVLAGAHLLLLAPMSNDLGCATAVHVNHCMAYPLNCDSPEFTKLAQHPRLLLAYDNTRQSRPGYVALGAAVTRIVGPAAAKLGLDRAYGEISSAYIPLILINLIVAVATVALLVWLLGRFGTPLPVVVALCSLLVLNDLMKAFFWTPHQQLFLLLVPLATIVAGRWVILRPPSWPTVALLGGGLGLASLLYGNLIVTVGVLATILLTRRWRGVAQAATLCVVPQDQRLVLQPGNRQVPRVHLASRGRRPGLARDVDQAGTGVGEQHARVARSRRARAGRPGRLRPRRQLGPGPARRRERGGFSHPGGVGPHRRLLASVRLGHRHHRHQGNVRRLPRGPRGRGLGSDPVRGEVACHVACGVLRAGARRRRQRTA